MVLKYHSPIIPQIAFFVNYFVARAAKRVEKSLRFPQLVENSRENLAKYLKKALALFLFLVYTWGSER